jgi:hypothetical protein
MESCFGTFRSVKSEHLPRRGAHFGSRGSIWLDGGKEKWKSLGGKPPLTTEGLHPGVRFIPIVESIAAQVGAIGLEPMTPSVSSWCSSQLS